MYYLIIKWDNTRVKTRENTWESTTVGSHNHRKHQPKQTLSVQQERWSSVTHKLCLKKQEHLAPGDWCWPRCHMLGPSWCPAQSSHGGLGELGQPLATWTPLGITGRDHSRDQSLRKQGVSSRNSATGADLETALVDKHFFFFSENGDDAIAVGQKAFPFPPE